MIQVNQQRRLEEDLLIHVFRVQKENLLFTRFAAGECRALSDPKPSLCDTHSCNWVLLIHPSNQKAVSS